MRVAGKISHLYRRACLCGQQLSKTDYRSDYSMQITLMSMPKIHFRESARFNPALIKNSNKEERRKNTFGNGAQNLCALISKPLEPQSCPSLIFSSGPSSGRMCSLAEPLTAGLTLPCATYRPTCFLMGA